MSHMTRTKYNRIFEEKVIRNKVGRAIGSVTIRKDKPTSIRERAESVCPVCDKPMYYSDGQRVFSHRACRYKSRHPND